MLLSAHVGRGDRRYLTVHWNFPLAPVVVTVTASVDASVDDEFNRWYDEDHLPRSLACPGFLAGARYRSSDDKDRQYLSLYVVESEETMATPELAAIRGFEHLTPHVRYDRRIFRPASGTVIRTPSERSDLAPHPAIGVTRASVAADHDDEFNRWYEDRHLPQTISCPGFRAGTRYVTSDGLEKSYLALYVIDSEDAFETPELAAIRGFEHLTPHVTYDRRIYRPLVSIDNDSGEVTRFDGQNDRSPNAVSA
jgi:hypothetical protein